MSVRPTVREIGELVRGLFDDFPGEIYSDDVLLPFLQSTYDDLQAALVEYGLKINVGYLELTVPANTKILSATSTPALPTDLIVPWELWEKPSTGSTQKYREMVKQDDLDDLDQARELRYWEWTGNEIRFIGADQETKVKIEYEKAFSELTLTGSTATVELRGSKNALAYGSGEKSAHMKRRAQGDRDLPDFGALYREEVAKLINRNLRPEQRQMRRRRAYGYRRYGH